MDFYYAPITRAAFAFDKAEIFTARDQCDRSVRFHLHFLGQLSDGSPFTAGESANMQQKQVLKRRKSLRFGGRFAEVKKPSQLIAEF